ncbi:hypothetical protein [Sphingobacterium sp. 2149]|uniref:hypothetical protein n=1 Tax=Sphingobacterium sp. 2149 TaxID=2817763 RepID=UPI002859CFAA|nr:hypothetical protein [Sphingobacterium sp. 2149]MDR6734200.1 hypothetical protein [Sphingobacterium sp. 2149]
MKKLSELTEIQMFDLFAITFSSNHSPGFKTAEVKTMLTDQDYWFLERPKEGYKEAVLDYLKENGFELPVTSIWI